ncbi:MAG: nickel-responsive transcriptional regulator NikR [Planctomycetota bacterium]|jgi:CopG family nickel-responsive transcriptional regulator
MSDLVRLSLSLEQPLCDKLEKLVKEGGYSNRSEFFRDLIREKMVEEDWENDNDGVGTITLIFDHHKRNLSEKLTDIQHHHHGLIMASTHVHLTHDLCAEMILVKGKAKEISHLADSLKKQKGVLHAALSISSTGKSLT